VSPPLGKWKAPSVANAGRRNHRKRRRVSVQLSMVGLVVEDMARALAFYRRLGLDIPAEADDRPHVEVRMGNGVTFFWDTAFAKAYDPDREPPSGGYRVLPELFLADRGAVDATYATLTGSGYRGHRAPFETAFGVYGHGG